MVGLFKKEATAEREPPKLITNGAQAQRDIATDYGAYRLIAEGLVKIRAITKMKLNPYMFQHDTLPDSAGRVLPTLGVIAGVVGRR